ncbi:MAG TPA: FtsQ-type POTRA domain-containing protein [Stellaceae bacterium]|nr:FtsQ-type POTRA domain-containing protein [Stellaceae bacterium]
MRSLTNFFHRRRLMRWGLGLGALMLLFAILLEMQPGKARLVELGARIGLKVARVELEGRDRENPQSVRHALGLEIGTPILGIDLAAAKARLEALPFVREAAIERRLPDTIYVQLTERQPLAFWQRHGTQVPIDREGKVMPIETLSELGPLIVLVGEDAPREGAALITWLQSEPDLFPRVTAAVRMGGRRWQLRLDHGMVVDLPEQNPESAWHLLAGLEREDHLLERDVKKLDFRLKDRLVVQVPPDALPKPPTAKAAPAKGTMKGKPA